MSIAEPAALYQEHTSNVTAHPQIDKALDDLAKAKSKFRSLAMRDRIALAAACLEGVVATSREWVEAACKAKGIEATNPARAEEISGGPMATARYLRLLVQVLDDIDKHGTPQLPGEVTTGPDGRLRVQVVPTRGLFDGVAFAGFKSHIWMQPGVTRANLAETQASYYRNGCVDEGISLILGAGNVSSIAPTDAFSKLFHEGKVVLLKMNPVNEYLGPIFAKAFAPLIDAGYLRIIYGGADVGSYAINHPQVDEVHITGSVYSHDTIVWGPPGAERERRKAQNDPRLKKEITSELGNVTPWIIVPGPYTDKELRFQAENLASSITNNASFNCIATKMIVTWKNWPDRQKFLGYLKDVLSKVPQRKAYYPGATDRYKKFAGKQAVDCSSGACPWTLVPDVDPDKQPLYFNEESFVSVFAETAIDAPNELGFLAQAVDFVNDRLWGTLGAAVMVHPKFRKQPANEAAFQKALADLRYGTIGINHWPALSYALMSPPWGGYPGRTLQDPQSGIGWVHNSYMFEKAEKTVLEGPLTIWPKPLWFPTNRGGEGVSWKVVELYHRPSVFRLPGVLLAALRS